MRQYVIVKASREYLGGCGYTGPSCGKADVTPGHIYTSKEDADNCCKRLNRVNRVGFDVVEYFVEEGKSTPRSEALARLEKFKSLRKSLVL